MVSGISGGHSGLESDFLVFYMVSSFGWNGSPSHFAQFGVAITLAHRTFGVERQESRGSVAFQSVLYDDNGIFSECATSAPPGRLGASAFELARFAQGLLRHAAINDDKMKEEGFCGTERIILGFGVNTQDLAILAPGAKIEGARILLGTFRTYGFQISDRRHPAETQGGEGTAQRNQHHVGEPLRPSRCPYGIWRRTELAGGLSFPVRMGSLLECNPFTPVDLWGEWWVMLSL